MLLEQVVSLATVRRCCGDWSIKGRWPGRRRANGTIYSPLVTMEECVHQESESFWDRVLGRAPSAALLHLVRRAELALTTEIASHRIYGCRVMGVNPKPRPLARQV